MAFFSNETRAASKSSGVLSTQITYRSYAFRASTSSGFNVSTVTRSTVEISVPKVKCKKDLQLFLALNFGSRSEDGRPNPYEGGSFLDCDFKVAGHPHA